MSVLHHLFEISELCAALSSTLYSATITIVALTALFARKRTQRRAARRVLKLYSSADLTQLQAIMGADQMAEDLVVPNELQAVQRLHGSLYPTWPIRSKALKAGGHMPFKQRAGVELGGMSARHVAALVRRRKFVMS